MFKEEAPVVSIIKTVLGAIICTVSPVFLVAGIFIVGVRWSLHPVLATVCLCFCLFLLFVLEGTQIAVVRLKERGHIPPYVYTRAPDVAQLLTQMGDDGVAMYLIGRQVLVCANVYIVAALTELTDPIGHRVLTVLTGIFTVVCYGQLIPQLAAEVDPVTFFKIPAVKIIIKICIYISKCGVGHFSYWVGVKMLACLNRGAVVPGDAEEGEQLPEVQKNVNKEETAREIYSSLNLDPRLDTKDPEHIPPHILLAVQLGLNDPKLNSQAQALLNTLLAEHPDSPMLRHLQKEGKSQEKIGVVV